MTGGTYSGELSYEAKRALSHLFPLIGQWRQRMESAPTPPEAGSSLLGDDRAVHPYLVSQAAHAQLISAADHWDALRTLLQEAQIVHARAPFTLLRAAIENSAAAVWLLAPASRNQRVLRRLRLEWKNFTDQENAEKLAAGEPITSRAGTKAELQQIARACGLTEDLVSQVASNPVAFSTIVRTAAIDAPRCGLTGIQALYCWMASSGIAHAQRWAVMSSSLLQQTRIPGAPAGSTRLALSASDKPLVVIAHVGAALTIEGWRLHDERCRNYLR
jgi:extradiol dioxygenase family protein